MKRFHCQNCSHEVFFANTLCEACGASLGFDPEVNDMRALVKDKQHKFVHCANHQHGACNWLVPAKQGGYCPACQHNRTIPDLSVDGNADLWREFEIAKRRLFYSLSAFGLPLSDAHHPLAFDCIDDIDLPGGDTRRAMTGHDNGLITIALQEADPARREKNRVELAEPYRTLLGHLRHEIGHYYWDVYVRDRPETLAAFRAMFGDERADYAEALAKHYAAPNPSWRQSFISAYASSHPWEDFAESWAHYLHMVDTLETARAFAVAPAGKHGARQRPAINPYKETQFENLVDAWGPLTIALNCVNRSMGLQDLYPFVTPPPALEKLRFIHDLIANARNAAQRRHKKPVLGLFG